MLTAEGTYIDGQTQLNNACFQLVSFLGLPDSLILATGQEIDG